MSGLNSVLDDKKTKAEDKYYCCGGGDSVMLDTRCWSRQWTNSRVKYGVRKLCSCWEHHEQCTNERTASVLAHSTPSISLLATFNRMPPWPVAPYSDDLCTCQFIPPGAKRCSFQRLFAAQFVWTEIKDNSTINVQDSPTNTRAVTSPSKSINCNTGWVAKELCRGHCTANQISFETFIKTFFLFFIQLPQLWRKPAKYVFIQWHVNGLTLMSNECWG